MYFIIYEKYSTSKMLYLYVMSDKCLEEKPTQRVYKEVFIYY